MNEHDDQGHRTSDDAWIERVIAEHWPMVLAVCQRYFPRGDDAKDLAQEVCVRAVRHAPQIYGNVGAWLAQTARSVCVDRIRREVRRPRAMGGEAITGAQAEPRSNGIEHSMLLGQIPAALDAMDDDGRSWIIDRYLHAKPLLELARARKISVPTASRRASEALSQLVAVLNDMAAFTTDEQELAAWLLSIDPIDPAAHCPGSDGQPLARGSWHGHDPVERYRSMADAQTPPGWSRPIRVGVLISWVNWSAPSTLGIYCEPEWTLGNLRHLGSAGYEMFAVVDPGSSSRGMIERSIREYEVTAGLLTWDQAETLDCLDVLVVGQTFHISGAAVRKIRAAVARGVGLYNESNLTCTDDGHDDVIGELCLSIPPMPLSCTPEYHGAPRSVRVHQTHPIIAGLSPSDRFDVPGCSHWCRPAPQADVLIAREDATLPTDPGYAEPQPMRMSVLLTGSVGDGRVVRINTNGGEPFHDLPQLEGKFFTNCLQWLAEPRREEGAQSDSSAPGSRS